MKYFRLIALAMLTSFCSLSIAADWPRFRGLNGTGRSDEKDMPVEWSAKKNIGWRTPMPGFGASSPIVIGDKVLLTCYSGYGLDAKNPGKQEDLRIHLVCVSRTTGKIQWDKKVEAQLPEEKYQRFLPEHGYASHTPVSDGDAVYVFYGKTGAHAYTIEGDEIWREDLGAETHPFGSSNSPILFEDLVIINANVENDALVALKKSDGEEVWRANGMKRAWNTPALVQTPDGKTEVVVSTDGAVLGFDARTGKSLWTSKGIDDYICPDVLIHDGVAYASGGRNPPTLLAVRVGGRGDVTKERQLWVATQVGSKISTPIHHEGRLYGVTHTGTMFCVDTKAGKRQNRKRLADEKTYAAPIYADGKIYIVTCSGGTFVLEATPEMKTLAHNVIEDDTSVFNATPAVVPGGLLLRSDRFLYFVSRKDTESAKETSK